MASSASLMKKEPGSSPALTPLQSPEKKPALDGARVSSASGGSAESSGVLLLPLGPPQNDREKQARQRIEQDHFDTGAWNVLAAEAQARPISEASTVALWEHLLAAFPTAGKWWRSYAEAHMGVGNEEAVKHVFSRCLLSCPYLDLWRSYLHFIQQSREGQAETREDIRKAWEFALSHVGLDIGAGALWEDYIRFLKAAPAAGTFEQSQRMGAVRKAYQQAVGLPVVGVEQLWKDYEHFENSLSRPLAKGLLAEHQPRFASARAVLRKRKRLADRVDFSMLAVPPGRSPKEEQQSVAWMQVLAYERHNPLRLEGALLAKSVSFAYDQCLLCLRLHTHVWYDYAAWHAHSGSPDAAVQVFQRALTALPDSILLHFAYAELEETRGHVQEAKVVLEALLRADTSSLSLGHIQLMRFLRRTEGVDAARKAFIAARKAGACSYHVHVASALLEFAVNKDAKVARNVFELGLKKHIHEPAYVLEYADFLGKTNDDRNMRALFERALSVLPPQEAEEVWSSYIEFERLAGDLVSVLKLEQRKRESVSKEDEEGLAAPTLDEVVPRYAFRDLLPCSAHELAHLARVQALTQAAEDAGDEGPLGRKAADPNTARDSVPAGKREGPARRNIVRPDVSQMAIYDPRQGLGMMGVMAAQPGLTYAASPTGAPLPIMGLAVPPMLQPSVPLATQMPLGVVAVPVPGPVQGLPPPAGAPPLPRGPPPAPDASAGGSGLDDSNLRTLAPALASFLAALPQVPGPYPEVDMVISVLLQVEIPAPDAAEGAPQASASGAAQPAPAASDSTAKGASNSGPSGAPSAAPGSRPPSGAKRKEPDRDEEAPSSTAPPPRDLYRWRLLQKARGASGGTGGGSYSGTYSGTLSGDRVSGTSN